MVDFRRKKSLDDYFLTPAGAIPPQWGYVI
jgi:hypothetical protein